MKPNTSMKIYPFKKESRLLIIKEKNAIRKTEEQIVK